MNSKDPGGFCATEPGALPPVRVVILCTGNSARSQMAEGWLRHLGGSAFETRSAGTRPAKQVNPLAVQVMVEAGVDISRQHPKHLERFVKEPWDYVSRRERIS